VSLAKRVDGALVPLAGPVRFEVRALHADGLPPAQRADLLRFQRKAADLQRAVLGAVSCAREAQRRIDHLERALADTPGPDPGLVADLRALELRLKDLQVALTGDDVLAAKNEPVPPAIQDRVAQVVGGTWYSTSAATRTHAQCYDVAAAQFAPVLERLRTLVETDLKGLEQRAENAGAPWTPGRVPTWQPE
jgi:hypothetical protein